MQKTETMSLQVQLRGMRNCGGLDLLIEECLNALRRLIPISTARVVLEQQRDTAPAFCVFAHLAVPGPDIQAAVRDHTLLAAWRTLARNLKKSSSGERRNNNSDSRAGDNVVRWPANGIAARELLRILARQNVLTSPKFFCDLKK